MSSTRIGIVNTKAGNITSLKAAIERVGFQVKVLETPEVSDIDRLVIPGQGRFGTVMEALNDNDWLPALENWRDEEKPVFGICVGFQIFFDNSEEDPGIAGLGWLPGAIKRLNSPKQPMVGWTAVNPEENSIIPAGEAYFVNSFVLESSQHACAYSQYGQRFTSAIQSGPICGVQFHPEKSSIYGMEVLRQCLSY